MEHSPCIRVCVLVEQICVGCRRSIDEIRGWVKMSDTEKQEIVERVSYKCEVQNENV